MKKILKSSFALLFILFSIKLSSQCSFTTNISTSGPTIACGGVTLTAGNTGNVWTQKANFGNGVRYRGVAFSIGNKGYMGTGTGTSTYMSDFWEYDPSNDTWTQKANYAGGNCYGAVGFASATKGYVGTGFSGSYKNDFYEYDPVSNVWNQKSNFAGTARRFAVGFFSNGKCYIGTGAGSSTNFNDLWEYDPFLNFWTAKASIPSATRYLSFGTAVGNLAYVGGGYVNGVVNNDVWEYSATSNTWTQKANIGTATIYGATALNLGSNLYVTTGYEFNTSTYSDKMWRYDSQSDTWTQLQSIGSGQGRYSASSFAIGLRAYVVGGYTTTTLNSTWEYEAPGTYSWSSGAIGQVFTPTLSGSYTVNITNASNCTATAVQAVSISPNPNLSVSGNTLHCSANSLTLVASGATSYTWSGNAVSSNSNSVVVSPSVNTSYTVSGTTGTCALDVVTNVSVNTSPNPAIIANGPTVACGAITLSTALNGNNWTQVAGVTSGRSNGVAFSIGNKGYFGTGYHGPSSTYFNDFWEYNPQTNAWTQKANFGGAARRNAVGFSINTKGYIGTGSTTSYFSDFWEYDPLTNVWTQKTAFSGGARHNSVGFGIGSKGYVGTGFNGSNQSDFYEYDPNTNLWTQKASVPGAARSSAIGFNLNNLGFVGLGSGNSPLYDFWEYNPSSNTWTQKANFTGPARYSAVGFAIGTKGYVGIGIGTSPVVFLNDFWEYDQPNNAWQQRTNFAGPARSNGSGFAILGKGYMGFGNTATTYNDFWQFEPSYVQWSSLDYGPTVSVSNSGIYSATVTSWNGCATSSAITVSISPNPTITATQPSLICAGTNNTIVANGATTYTWSANAGSAQSNAVVVSPTSSIIYTVSGTTGSCTVSEPISVFVYDIPAANISVSGPTVGCGSISFSTNSSGDTWTQKPGMNSGRRYAVSFTIGSKGYVGTGASTSSTYLKDFWEFDPVNNSWTQKADFGGTGRQGAAGFSIGNKGYIGTGYDGNNKSDFWEYNPTTNTWSQKASYAYGNLQFAFGMSIGNKGYFGLGTNGVSFFYSTIYEYDPSTDVWTFVKNFTGGSRAYAATFTIGNKGYIWGGSAGSTYYNDFWEFDPSNSYSLTQKSSFSTPGRSYASGFSIGNLGYVSSGLFTSSSPFNDLWEFNPSSNTWLQRATGPFSVRYSAQAFAIGANAYLMNGYSLTSPNYPNDMWQYSPVNSLSWSNGSTLQATSFSTSGTCSLLVTNQVGCSASSVQAILLSPNPNMSVNIPTLMCAGINNTITASGANTYTWSANAGSSNSSSAVINPTTSTTYTVSGTTGSCTVNFPVVINVTATPVATISVSGATVGCGPRTLVAGVVSNTWVQKAGITAGRANAVSFSIGNKGYIGTGSNGSYLNDFWEYDPSNNVWTQKANFGGIARIDAAGFSIGNFGYIGTGFSSSYRSDFWQYNPLTNTWLQKANFPGTARHGAVGFSLLNKGYLGTGANNSGNFNDFWEYDPNNDTWTQKANVGGGLRGFGAGFAIGDKGYIGLGYINSNTNDIWEYNPTNDTWVQKANFPGAARQLMANTSAYGKGFIGTGYGSNSQGLSDFWEFDPLLNTWIQRATVPGFSRYAAGAFTINGKVYLTCGYSSLNGYFGDLWEYSTVLNYNWSNSVTTQTNQVINSGNYSVTVTNLGGCSNSSSITLSLSPNPTITISGTNTACSGQTNTLTAMGAGSYTWSTNAGGGNLNFAVVSPSITTTYSITGATGSCSVTDPIIVTPIVSPNSSIAVSGPTLGCGSLTLSNTNGGNTWLQIANITGNKGHCIAFSLFGKGYVGVGGGYNLAKDLWEYDPTNNNWTQKSNFPGVARNGAFAFTVGNLAYVGGGTDNSTNKNDFYSYNPITNTWMQLADFPQAGIANAAAFSIGTKGYVGTGQIAYNTGTYTTLFYEYDPNIDAWTPKANFGGNGRRFAVGFSIGTKGYITTGEGNSPLYNQDIWEYDPLINTWTQKANLTGGGRAWSSGFSIANYGYVYGGAFGSTYLTELWEYNQSNNTWTQRQSSPGNGKIYSVGFAIAGRGYVGTGYSNTAGNFSSDFYVYTPTNSHNWSTSSTLQSISVNSSNNYSLTLTSLNGCVSSSVQTIALSPNPTVNVVGNSAALCAGNVYTLQANGAGSYTWSANAGNSNSNVVLVNPSVTTIYTLTGATGSCAVDVPVEVTVFPTANANIAFSGASCGSAVSLSTSVGPGNTWTQKTGITGARDMAFSLVIGSKAYVGTGWNIASNYYNDFWEYNPANNSWTQKANFGGTGRIGASAFSINGKGYAALGFDGTYKTDLWEYDPMNNTWIQKANYTGTARYTAVGFSIGTKGYIASGKSNSSYHNDIYEYDPNLNTWTFKTTFSSHGRLEPTGFVINNLAYIGMGYNGSTYLTDLWEYNPLTNAVTQKANIGGSGRYASTSFVLANRGFVSVGYVNGVGISNQIWEYNATSNTWLQRANFGGGNRQRAVGFSINNKGYIATGTDASFNKYSDLWEYNPANTFTWSTGSTLQAITATISGSYSVQTNNIFGCGSSASQSITLGQTPTISISGPSLVCAGTSLTLSVSGANGYSWSANAGSSSSSDVVLTPSSSTTYSVIGANGACTTTATKAIFVNPLPIVGANATSVNVCSGTTISLFGSGAATYTWSNGVTNNSVFTPSLTNTYTVSGTDFNACTNTAIVTVTVNSIPAITVNSGTICEGQSFTLTPSGANTYTYSSGSSIVSPMQSSTYSVSGTSTAGCVSSSPVISTVNVLSSPTLVVSGGTVCSGQSFTLSPSGALNYTFSGGNSIVSPTTNTSYTITGTNANGCVNYIPAIATITVNALPNVSAASGSICSGNSFTINPTGALSYTYSSGSNVVTPLTTTTYSLFGSNAAGCSNTLAAIVTVTVNSIPAITVNSGTICEGQSFTLTPSGANTYTYSSGSSIVSPMQSSTYSVSGTSTAGCVSSSPVISTVNVLSSPTLVVSGGTVCSGQSFTLSPSGALNYTFSGGNSIVSPTTNTSYTITGTNANGCVNYIPAIATITVNALPNVSAASGSICSGGSFTINPTGALSYTYSSGSNVVTPLTTNTYSLFGSNAAGCSNTLAAIVTVTVNSIPAITVNSGTICEGQSFTLTPSGANTYTYSSGSSIVSPMQSSTYSVSGTSTAGCVSSSPVISTVNVLSSPTLVVSGGTVCSGQSFTLSPSGALNYTFSGGNSIVSPTTNTSYTITGTNANGCVNYIPAIATITVNALPNVSAASGSICSGGSFTINPTGALSYTYSSGSNVVTPLTTTTYSLFGSNAAGCSNTLAAIVTVTVNSIPAITVNSGTICEGQSFTLTPSGANTYTYSSGSSIVSPMQSSTYSVSGTSTAGCVSSSPVISTVNVLSSPTLVVSGGTVCSGQSFTLSPSGALNYTFSGGNSIVSPTTNTSYTITGTNANGCVNYIPAIATITVNALPNVSAASGSICSGNSFTINPTGALSYTYSSGSNVVTPLTTTTYSLFGSNAAGCSNTLAAIVTVTVNSIPAITVNSGTICEGQSFTLTPSGANTYTYSSGSSIVSPMQSSTYSVSGTSTAGCVSSSPVISTVNVLSSPTLVVSGGTVCSGQSFTLSPSGALNYTFSGGNSIVSPTTNTSYTITGTNANGCVNYIPAIATITVNALPNVSAASGSICSGGSFTINPTGALSYTYSSGSNVVTPLTTTTYSLFGSNAAGCSNTLAAIVTVTVNSIPAITVNSGTICEGQSFTLTPSGANTYTYSSGSSIVSPMQSSTYSVSGTSTAGCVSSSPVISTVNVLSSPTLVVSGGTVCSGQSFTLSPSGALNYTFSGGNSIVSPTTNTSYTITGTNANGCVNYIPAIATITVNTLPNVSAASGSICSGNSFTINPTGALSYTYSSGSNVVTPTITTTYSVLGTNSNNCVSNVATTLQVVVLSNPTITVNPNAVICPGNSYTISPNGGVTYSYSGGSNVVNPLTTTSYTITGYSAQGCSGIAIITVSVQATLSLSIVGTTIVCEGESYTLTSTGANTYTWSTGATGNAIIITPSTSTVYSVSGGGGNCLGSATHSVSFNPKPNVSAYSSSSLICAEETVTLFANGATTYTWSNGVSGDLITINPTLTSNYSVVGTDLNSCSNTAVYTQSVDACLGLTEGFKKQEMRIDVYPNPSNGEVAVSFAMMIEKPTIELYNYLGQLILKENVTTLITNLNFKTLANGVYTLKVVSSDKVIFVDKIIKQE